ncbi:MAG: hypothetical protein ABFS28_08425 [Bacteroidota bacterium]
MRFRFITLACLLLFAGITVTAQSKKTIRDKEITTQTVHEYFIEEGYKNPVVESIERYNEDGDLLEIKVFNREGDIKQWEKYAYNRDREVVEEVHLDARGRVTRTEKNIYEDGLRVEKQFYNQKGKLYKKKVYEYDYRQ